MLCESLYYHHYRVQKAKSEFEAVQADLFALVTNSETDALRLNNLLMEFPKLQVKRLSIKRGVTDCKRFTYGNVLDIGKRTKDQGHSHLDLFTFI